MQIITMNKMLALLAVVCLSCTAQKKTQQPAAIDDVQRIIKTLSADDMMGRAAFTPGAEKAASFIENEFRKIGLQPMPGQTGFRQNFSVTKFRTDSVEVKVNGRTVGRDSIFVLTDRPSIQWNTNPKAISVKGGESLYAKYEEISKADGEVLVLVDTSLAKEFSTIQHYLQKGRTVIEPNTRLAAVFVLTVEEDKDYSVNMQNTAETSPLFNVAGVIPGKSRPKEIVIFSAHYDHIGILPPVDGDSIANGADDDASGVTGVISLAKHFSRLNNNERTLMFVAFAAEELGMIGSKYFSRKLNPEEVVAMFNMEMIGKESKFGKNAAFITGFERSDFGKILQKNLAGTDFSFHPDPYPQLKLFYRSDNATLAALGVPAHTISTDQIDKDKYYHTVDDEYQTLDVANIKSTIQAIALSSRTIVSGEDTPQRVEKQK